MKEMLDILKKIHEEEVGEKRRIKEERFEEDEIVTSADPASCLDTFTQFLPFSHFTRNLWLGLVPSLGGIAIGTVRFYFHSSILSCDLFQSLYSANKAGIPFPKF